MYEQEAPVIDETWPIRKGAWLMSSPPPCGNNETKDNRQKKKKKNDKIPNSDRHDLGSYTDISDRLAMGLIKGSLCILSPFHSFSSWLPSFSTALFW